MQNCFDNTSPDKIVVYMHVYIYIYIYSCYGDRDCNTCLNQFASIWKVWLISCKRWNSILHLPWKKVNWKVKSL